VSTVSDGGDLIFKHFMPCYLEAIRHRFIYPMC